MNEITNVANDATTKPITNRFYIAAWRWHFYAGLYVAPFLIMLAITGLMMLFIVQFDGRDGEKVPVTPAGEAQSLSVLQEAVEAKFPAGVVTEWIGARSPDQAILFRVKEDDAQLFVAVDQYQGKVVSSWERRTGWYDWADNVHGSILLGDLGDRLIEIAAGFGLILVITGVYLWWPRDKGFWQSLKPDFTAKRRNFIKSLHQSIGIYSAILLVFFLLSGMAWTGIWGAKFVQAWSSFPAQKFSAPTSTDDVHAKMNHGATKDVPWALEQTPMPKSGADGGVVALDPQAINSQTVYDFGSALGFQGRFHINYPQGEDGVWTLSQDSMSTDSENPWGDRTLHIDQYSGKILGDVHYKDYSIGGKTMAVGISFHMGTMGLWNFILNVVFCLGIIFISISGIIMWWMRRPSKAGRLAAPKLPNEMPFWKGAAFIMLFISMAFPLVGLTLIALLAVDILIIQNIKPLAKMLS